MSAPQDPSSDQKPNGAPGPAANYLMLSAGSIFTSMFIAGFLVGYALDELFDTRPIFMLACGLLGFVGGIQKVIRVTQRLDHYSPEKKDD